MPVNADCEVLEFIKYASMLRIKNATRLIKEDIPPAFAYVLADELRANRQISRRCSVYLARLCPDKTQSRNNAQKNRLDAGISTFDIQTASEMLIVSATAEIIGITRRLSANGDCSERVVLFCEKVIESENQFIDRLRSFL